MTKQEYQVVKTIINACSKSVLEGGKLVAYADTDRVIASLDNIFADELGVGHEPMLKELWNACQEADIKNNEKLDNSDTDDDSNSSNFWTKIYDFIYRRDK